MSLRGKYFATLLAVTAIALAGVVAIMGKIVIDDKKIYFRDMQLTQLVRLREVIRDRYEIARLIKSPAPRFDDLELGNDVNDVWVSSTDGKIVAASSARDLGASLSDRLSVGTLQAIKAQGASQGSFEGYTTSSERNVISFSALPEQKLLLVSATPMSALYRIISVFAAQLAGGLLSLGGIAFAVSHWLSGSMTERFKVLSKAMNSIQSGDFTAKASVGGSDELAQLGDQLEVMAKRLASLLEDREVKIRTDEELRTAKIVQENLFPESEHVSDYGTVVGSYSPASEVSGDWWTTFVNGGRQYLVIADATGHGVAAALMTSAATAAMAILQDRGGLTPATLLRETNLAIFRTSKGQMQMTMFVAAYEPQTRTLTFANASHEFPFIVSSAGDAKSSIPLTDGRGPRLGEALGSEYVEERIELAVGQTLLMFTDGLHELTNELGQMLSDRGLFKILSASRARSATFTGFARNFKIALLEYNRGPLKDDFTMVQFEPARGG